MISYVNNASLRCTSYDKIDFAGCRFRSHVVLVYDIIILEFSFQALVWYFFLKSYRPKEKLGLGLEMSSTPVQAI